jgi:hypothetical protein
MRAFVIRGFGQKAGVDFDRVHEELIGPALREVGADGDTTGEIVEAGNIREDMFREIVLADIVVADISVHNANVFYELGVRHALRNRSTVLIRARIDSVPFDLSTDRYLSYDPAAAAASVPLLVDALRSTLASERTDSPVYGLLPGLTPTLQAPLLKLPRDLDEDIKQARRAGNKGVLRLLAEEVKGLRFEEAARRAIASASEQVGDDDTACRVWELIRAVQPTDYDANYALANVYRRLSQPDLSDQAINRALENRSLTPHQRAELYGMLASNVKRQWIKQWRKASEQDRASVALQSPELDVCFQHYRRGFDEDLNDSYPGLNALAIAKIRLALAARCRDTWVAIFPTDADADAELRRLETEVEELTPTVRAAIESARSRNSRAGTVDFWIDVSAADLGFLTTDEPERVASAYLAACSGLGSGASRSVRDQVQMYYDLGIFLENAQRVMDVLPPSPDRSISQVHPLVFSGHMIDAPGRAHPRFPADQENTAKAQIEEAIREIRAAAEQRKERVIGMAGALNGGDLLFNEVCHDLGIQTVVFLPVPEIAYRTTAISGPASGWAERYHEVLDKAEKVLTLARTETQPGWLLSRPDYSTWQRSNRWIMHHAWATTTDKRVTVLALWNGQPGDGPGGVADLVAAAEHDGAEVRVLDTVAMFGLPEPAPQEVAGPAPEAADVQAAEVMARNPVLELVWRYHRQWSAAAGQAEKSLNRWRVTNLTLLVLGAITAAIAAQTWLTSAGLAWFAAVSAGLIALAGVVQGWALTPEKGSRWTRARAASEALKAETYRYLTGVQPYAGVSRTEQLQAQLDVVQDRARELGVDQQLAVFDGKALPEMKTFRHYVDERARGQADWHKRKIDEHAGKARWLYAGQLAATAAGTALAALGGVMPGWHLGAWTAAATTVAAAFGAHIAATHHQRIAASYAATADQLDRLVAAVDPDTTDTSRQAQFVADVERVLATQNEGWTDLLSPSVRKKS